MESPSLHRPMERRELMEAPSLPPPLPGGDGGDGGDEGDGGDGREGRSLHRPLHPSSLAARVGWLR